MLSFKNLINIWPLVLTNQNTESSHFVHKALRVFTLSDSSHRERKFPQLMVRKLKTNANCPLDNRSSGWIVPNQRIGTQAAVFGPNTNPIVYF